MSSTYSPNLALELIGAGEQAGNWGSTTNTNLGTLLEQAISGYTTYSCTGGTDTLAMTNGASATARNMFLQLNGTGGGSVVVPATSKLYFIFNNTASAITVKVTTGISVPAAAKMVLVCNGTDVVAATNYMATLTAGTLGVLGTLGVIGTTTLTGSTVLTGGVSGAGINAYLAAPPAIGGAAPAAGSFTTVSAAGAVAAAGAVSGSAVSDSLSNVRSIPLQTKTAPYTLVATDNGQCITTNSAVTIPASIFTANNIVTIYNSSGATVAITQGSGLTLQFAGQATSTTGNRTLALYSITTVLFLSPTSAVITGAGLY
jgi:hypothetical protein